MTAKTEISVLDDGFGNTCSIVCPKCGRESMQIVRIGCFRCYRCGTTNPQKVAEAT